MGKENKTPKPLNILMKHNPDLLSSKYAIDYGITPLTDAMEEYHELCERAKQSEQQSNCNLPQVINCGYTEVVKAVENGLTGNVEKAKDYVKQYIDKHPKGIYARPFSDLINNVPRRIKLE